MKFFIWRETKSKPTWPCVKSACPLNLITGWATLAATTAIKLCDNLRLSLLQRCGGILPTHLGRIVVIQPPLEGFRAWTAFLRSCHSISIGFRSGLWLGHSKVFIVFFFSHSEVDFLVVLDHVLLQNTSSLQLEVTTDGRTLSFRIFW